MIMTRKNTKIGFTLVEVMLSLFITAILITVLSVVFNTGLRAYRQGRELIDIAKRAQLVMNQITLELSGARNFISDGSDSMFFRAPADNTNDFDLMQITYEHRSNDNTLRRCFPTRANILCPNVTTFGLSYSVDGISWQNTWSGSDVPDLVEIRLGITVGARPEEIFVTRVYLPNSTNN